MTATLPFGTFLTARPVRSATVTRTATVVTAGGMPFTPASVATAEEPTRHEG
jgi:hypothetical protein